VKSGGGAIGKGKLSGDQADSELDSPDRGEKFLLKESKFLQQNLKKRVSRRLKSGSRLANRFKKKKGEDSEGD